MGRSLLPQQAQLVVSLAGVLSVFLGGYVLFGGGNSEKIMELFEVAADSAPVIAETVSAGVQTAGNVATSSSSLGSSLLGGGDVGEVSGLGSQGLGQEGLGGDVVAAARDVSAPRTTSGFLTGLFTLMSRDGAVLSMEALPWNGKIYETLTPYETLVGVEMFDITYQGGDTMRLYSITSKDSSIGSPYHFLRSLALGANSSAEVQIQDASGEFGESFSYINLAEPSKARIVLSVSEREALAIDVPASRLQMITELFSYL